MNSAYNKMENFVIDLESSNIPKLDWAKGVIFAITVIIVKNKEKRRIS